VVFNCCFDDTDVISHGNAATQLRCGGILNNSFITIFSLFWQWKKFENWLAFDKVKTY